MGVVGVGGGGECVLVCYVYVSASLSVSLSFHLSTRLCVLLCFMFQISFEAVWTQGDPNASIAVDDIKMVPGGDGECCLYLYRTSPRLLLTTSRWYQVVTVNATCACTEHHLSCC